MTVHWSLPVWLWPLLLVMAAGAVFWTLRAYRQTRPRPSPKLGRLLVLLRAAVFLLLAVAVAGPILSLLETNRIPAELVVLVEDSGSMAIADAGEASLPLSRWDASLRLGAALDSAMSRHEPPVRVTLLRGNGLDPVREFRRDDPVIPAPGAHGTNLERLLRQSRDFTIGRPVGAVVLLSDGNDTKTGANAPGPSRSAGAATTAAIDGRPLKVVGVGDPQGPADRVLKDLRYPDTAYLGDKVVVEFEVDHRFTTGTVSAPMTVRLKGAAGVVAAETRTTTDKVVSFALEFEPASEGVQVYELEVSGLDNERFLDNNRASLAVDVRQERARLLLLTATPGWDVRFLAQAAGSEERIELAVVRPSPTGLVFADSQVVWTPPQSPEEWLVWDGLVLVGWSGPLADLTWPVLAEAVNRGLGLLVLPGTAPTASAPPSGLASLLPVADPSWFWTEGPLFSAAPAAAVHHPVFEGLAGILGDFEKTALLPLPPLQRIIRTGAGARGEVLLTGRRRSAAVDAVDLPLLVVQPAGDGRVAWFGGQHLWELGFWRSGAGARDGARHEAFGPRLLRNLLVWTAAGAEESGLSFTGRASLAQEGERVRIAAQWRDMRGLPVTGRKLSLQVRADTGDSVAGRVQTFAMRMLSPQTGLAEVQLPPLPPGRYAIQLVGEGEPPVTSREEMLVVAGHSVERTQVRLDRRRLVQLAARSDGDFRALGGTDLAASLIADLKSLEWTEGRTEQRNRFDFWSRWPFLLLVCTLLGLEWFLRRRHGQL
jgi:hypothetical protein